MAIHIPEVINKENILKRVSQTQIMEYYMRTHIELETLVKSPLRRDPQPSCKFYISRGGVLRFADYSRKFVADCFDVVMHIHSCSFFEALVIINKDFRLGLGYGDLKDKAIPVAEPLVLQEYHKAKEKADIRITAQPFTYKDSLYWGGIGITEQYLKGFDVYSAKHVWLNGQRIFDYSFAHPCYGYYFDGLYKIYRPYETDWKWLSNTTSKNIQGWKQLPNDGKKRELCLITKSLKDVMVLRTLGFYAIAPQGEGNRIDPEIIDSLYERFDNLIVFYDNDMAGLIMAEKTCEEHSLSYMTLPVKLGYKDISDFRRDHSAEESRKIVQTLIYG